MFSLVFCLWNFAMVHHHYDQILFEKGRKYGKIKKIAYFFFKFVWYCAKLQNIWLSISFNLLMPHNFYTNAVGLPTNFCNSELTCDHAQTLFFIGQVQFIKSFWERIYYVLITHMENNRAFVLHYKINSTKQFYVLCINLEKRVWIFWRSSGLIV